MSPVEVMSVSPGDWFSPTGVITTGSEVASGRIQDTFTPILAKKLQAYGITMTEHLTVGDGLEQVAAAIAEMRKNRST